MFGIKIQIDLCKCGLDYQIDLSHITYNNQHFEPIEYACDVRNTQFQFETQNSKSFVNLDNHLMLSKPMKQEMQTLAQKKRFNWNDDLDCVLIKLLETYSNAPLEYNVQPFNSSCNTNVTKTQVHNHIQYMRKKNKENFVSFVNFAIPMSMPNNILISPIIENNCLIVRDLSIIKNTSMTKNIPMVENAPIVENVPITENVPTVNMMPISENVPIVEKTRIIKNVQIIK
jgi:hypothetical protein